MVGSRVHLLYGCDEMTDIVEQLRDPKLDHDCLHRLVAADTIESLRQQLKVQQDAANHWFTEANNDHNRCVKLEQQLAESDKSTLRLLETIKYLVGIAERGEGRKQLDGETVEQFVLGYVKRIEQQLAECQAQNAKLAERVVGVGEIAINSVSRQALAECQAREPDGLLEWAVERWNSEVANRPLINIHRRSLDDTWRQLIRKLGGDPNELLGPDHSSLLSVAPKSVREELRRMAKELE